MQLKRDMKEQKELQEKYAEIERSMTPQQRHRRARVEMLLAVMSGMSAITTTR